MMTNGSDRPPGDAESAIRPTARVAAVADCIEEAARFVGGQTGGVDRLLTAHRCRSDGSCGGCGHRPTRWPCSLVAIAERARELAAGPSRVRLAREPRCAGRRE